MLCGYGYADKSESLCNYKMKSKFERKVIKKALRKIYRRTLSKWYADAKFCLRFHLNPQGLVSEKFHRILGYEIDWKHPKDINEKINWMKFNYSTSEWTRLADKYQVREYVKERLGESVLTQLYGVWKKAEDIDFDKLPSKFVLKTNHAWGTVLPVLDKSKINVGETRKTLNKWLTIRFGYETMEPHYLKIRPLIIAEEYLENDAEFSSSIVDYKVWCFSGTPFCIMVCTDRIIEKHAVFSFFDTEWNALPAALSKEKMHEQIAIPRPKELPMLLSYAQKLAQGHPQVRVDFYIVKGKAYFGEMTFTSNGGFMDYLSRDFSLKMGQLVKLPIDNDNKNVNYDSNI